MNKTTHTDHPLRHYDRTCPACNEPAALASLEPVYCIVSSNFCECNKQQLYSAATVERLVQERDEARRNEAAIRTLMECYQLGGCTDHERLARNLAASQAREQQLRAALEICKKEMKGDKWDSLYIDGVLAKDKP